MRRIPEWLSSNNPLHSHVIRFLDQNHVNVEDYRKKKVGAENFFPDLSLNSMNLSQFIATKDSLLYSSVISAALEKSPQLLVDLGTGSAVPLISALLKTKSNSRALAIDLDPHALHVAKDNLEKFNLKTQVEIRLQSIEDFLTTSDFGESTSVALTSNPPYLPCPETSAPDLLPVNGGEDGTVFIEKILRREYPTSFIIGLQWGSVTNPNKVIDLIDRHYDVLNLQAWEMPFGRYSLIPSINDHIHAQKLLGKSIFHGGKESEQSQIVFGALLARKQKIK